MLPKSRRLSLKRDFDRIFSVGQSFQGKIFRLKFLKNNLKNSRFAVVVSSKVSKRAVVRNKIRRRAWSIISKADNLPSGLDIVLVALPEAGRVDFSVFKNEISFFINKRLS